MKVEKVDRVKRKRDLLQKKQEDGEEGRNSEGESLNSDDREAEEERQQKDEEEDNVASPGSVSDILSLCLGEGSCDAEDWIVGVIDIDDLMNQCDSLEEEEEEEEVVKEEEGVLAGVDNSPRLALTIEEEYKIHELMVCRSNLLAQVFRLMRQDPDFEFNFRNFLLEINTGSTIRAEGLPFGYVESLNRNLFNQVVCQVVLQNINYIEPFNSVADFVKLQVFTLFLQFPAEWTIIFLVSGRGRG